MPPPRRRDRDDEDDEDYDDRPRRRRSKGSRDTSCPRCGDDDRPLIREKVSQQGWLFFFIMAFFLVTLPICWLPLIFMKEKVRVCQGCGSQIDL